MLSALQGRIEKNWPQIKAILLPFLPQNIYFFPHSAVKHSHSFEEKRLSASSQRRSNYLALRITSLGECPVDGHVSLYSFGLFAFLLII